MNVEEFADLVQMPFAMVVASKRNSGKTMFVSQLIKALVKSKKVYVPIVYSNTAHLNGDYSFLPEGLVRRFQPENLKAMLDKQASLPKTERKPVLLEIGRAHV